MRLKVPCKPSLACGTKRTTQGAADLHTHGHRVKLLENMQRQWYNDCDELSRTCDETQAVSLEEPLSLSTGIPTVSISRLSSNLRSIYKDSGKMSNTNFLMHTCVPAAQHNRK
jgi:hypothetical protein